MKYIIKQTDKFSKWLDELKDTQGRNRIVARIKNVGNGNFGDWKPIEAGLCELRIDIGPAYRVYYGQIGPVVYLIVAGGHKGTQKRDIASALALWQQIKEGGYDDPEN